MQEQNHPDTQRVRFSHWLENVFWYHYKWYYFAGVFAAVLIVVSVIAAATRVDYDWTVQYVHRGGADPASVAAVQEKMLRVGSDRSGNGRVQIRIEEHCGSAAPGREDLFGLVRDSDNVLFVLDGETRERFQALGYFPEGVSLGDGLWAFVVDTPVTPYTWEEYEAYGYSEEDWQNSNAYLEEQHAMTVAAARELLAGLS